MKKIIIALLLLGECVLGQSGEHIYQFLDLSTSPRNGALGGKHVSNIDYDVNNLEFNPAAFSENTDNAVSLNYTSYIDGINYGNFIYGQHLSHEDYIYGGVKFIGYGDFIQSDEVGNITGNFKANDLALNVGYAKKIADNINLGAKLTYISSKIESYQSNGLALDLGATYMNSNQRLKMGLTLRNLGFQLSAYDKRKEKLPFEINYGITRELEHLPLAISVSLQDLQQFDISNPILENGNNSGFLRKAIDHVALGAELFPRRAFNLRLGYNFKRANDLTINEKKSFSGMSFGFGLRLNSIKINYAHQRFHAAGHANSFGLTADLEKILSKR